MQAHSFVTVICITKKSLSTFLRDIRSCYFQQEQSKGLWKAVSSSQWNCVRVWEKFSSWKSKEIYCSYFCQPFNTYVNKGFILDIYLSALPSHAHKQNVTKLSVLCIGSTRTTESMEQWSIIRHFKISRETESVLCRIATWDFFGNAFADFTTFIRIACVAVVERGRGRGLGEREKTRLPRRLFTTITELHRKLGQNSFPKTVSQYYAIPNNTATISSAASKWMDANLGKKRHASFPRHLAGRLIVRKDALEPERCKLKLKLACWGRDGTGRLKEIVSRLKSL